MLMIVPVAMLWSARVRWTVKLRVCIMGIVSLANIGLAIARTVTQYERTSKDRTCRPPLPPFPPVHPSLISTLAAHPSKRAKNELHILRGPTEGTLRAQAPIVGASYGA